MRKIVQVASIPASVVDDPVTRTREVTLPATVALCDDGTLWFMQHTNSPDKPVRWESYLPIPQP
jgi:hypothetical protein